MGEQSISNATMSHSTWGEQSAALLFSLFEDLCSAALFSEVSRKRSHFGVVTLQT